MNKRFRRKKKGSKISIIIFIIIVGIFCSYMLISVFSNKVSDIFMSYAESETTKLMTLVINKSVTKQMANSFDDKLLFDIVKDAAGNIKLIDFNSLEVNKTLNMITNLVALNLKMIEEGNIEMVDIFDNSEYDVSKLKKGIIYEIPMGAVTKSSLIANLGPKIPVRMHIIGDVVSDLETNVKEYGINNALIEIGVSVSVNSLVNLPFVSKKITVSTVIPLSLKLIQGNIPSYYYSYGIKNDPNLALTN